MSSFSLGNISDFLESSSICVKPEKYQNEKKVEINLNDCLACSGCITSAESVLVKKQTYKEIITTINETSKSIFVSISPLCITTLAQYYSVSFEIIKKRLFTFFKKKLRARYVFDTSFANLFALELVTEEFCEKWKSEKLISVPLFTSECPGWICYAEKKLNSEIIDNISTSKSPQQIMATIVKEYIPSKVENFKNLQPCDIYHVCIMPCFDKKLEASRDVFMNESNDKDVDCVISASELVDFINEHGPLEELSCPILNSKMDKMFFESISTNYFPFVMSTTGGYLIHTLIGAAKKLFDIELSYDPMTKSFYPSKYIEVIRNRNCDYTEYILKKEGTSLMIFAAIYGFRNIQTFLQKSKRSKIKYDFVEIMACPGACLMGGGQPQMLNKKTKSSLRTLNDALNKIIDDIDDIDNQENDSYVLKELYEDVYSWSSKKLPNPFRTSFELAKTSNDPIINVLW